MRARITKMVAALTALAALAFGGAALASAGSKASPPQSAQPAAQVQQGDQTTPDTSVGEQLGSAQESAAEQADPAHESAAEQADSGATESASELAGNDGPGGHADEPGNANADNQYEGQQ